MTEGHQELMERNLDIATMTISHMLHMDAER